jgi:putative ABC transport system permease protein
MGSMPRCVLWSRSCPWIRFKAWSARFLIAKLRRFNAALIAAFAFAAILLAALGIYGVIAFSAALRTQEMAIRIALSSQRSGILRLVFASAAKLAVGGCALGLLGAAAASRLLRSFLFGVSPFDPLVLLLAAVFVLILTLALLASWTAR